MTQAIEPRGQSFDSQHGSLDLIARHNASIRSDWLKPQHDEVSTRPKLTKPDAEPGNDVQRLRERWNKWAPKIDAQGEPSRKRQHPESASNASTRRSKKIKSQEESIMPENAYPLSIATMNSNVSMKDIEAFVNRPYAERKAEAERKGKVPRPMNSFMLYRAAFSDRLKAMGDLNNHQIISKSAGESWAVEPSHVKDQFEAWARIERTNHQNAHPEYKFQPVKNNSRTKRKMEQQEGEVAQSCDYYRHVENTQPFGELKGYVPALGASESNSSVSSFPMSPLPFDRFGSGLKLYQFGSMRNTVPSTSMLDAPRPFFERGGLFPNSNMGFENLVESHPEFSKCELEHIDADGPSACFASRSLPASLDSNIDWSSSPSFFYPVSQLEYNPVQSIYSGGIERSTGYAWPSQLSNLRQHFSSEFSATQPKVDQSLCSSTVSLANSNDDAGGRHRSEYSTALQVHPNLELAPSLVSDTKSPDRHWSH